MGFNSLNTNTNEEQEKQEEARLNTLMNNLLADKEKIEGVYNDSFIVLEARKYNIDPKFVEYVYRGLINSETIKNKAFMGSYVAHNPNLDKEPHKWAQYMGVGRKE